MCDIYNSSFAIARIKVLLCDANIMFYFDISKFLSKKMQKKIKKSGKIMILGDIFNKHNKILNKKFGNIDKIHYLCTAK